MARSVSLHLGALAPQIAEQLQEQGLRVSNCDLWQRCADGLTALRIQGLLPQAAYVRAAQKLINRIAKEAQPATGAADPVTGAGEAGEAA